MKKSPIKKFALCFVAILMCLSLAGGTYFLLDSILPETEQSENDPDRNKKDWATAGADVAYLDGAGTENNPWKISSAKEWAFLGNAMKTLKMGDVEDSAMAVAQALSGEDLETVVASAQARASGEISATAFSVEDERPATAYITVKKAEAEVNALSDLEKQNPQNFYEEKRSVVRANWEVYSSSSFVNNFELTQDIDLSEYAWMPIASMSGNFNGNGHTIDVGTRTFTDQNVSDPSIINDDGDILIAPFATGSGSWSDMVVTGEMKVYTKGSIQDANGQICLGGIVAYLEDPVNQSFSHSFNSCMCNINYNYEFKTFNDYIVYQSIHFGGIIGNARCGALQLEKCFNNGNFSVIGPANVTVASEINVGGLVGRLRTGNVASTLKSCANYGDIKVNIANSGGNDVREGGLVAFAWHDAYQIKFEQCANFGTISCEHPQTNNEFLGGFLGLISGQEVYFNECGSYGSIKIEKPEPGITADPNLLGPFCPSQSILKANIQFRMCVHGSTQMGLGFNTRYYSSEFGRGTFMKSAKVNNGKPTPMSLIRPVTISINTGGDVQSDTEELNVKEAESGLYTLIGSPDCWVQSSKIKYSNDNNVNTFKIDNVEYVLKQPALILLYNPDDFVFEAKSFVQLESRKLPLLQIGTGATGEYLKFKLQAGLSNEPNGIIPNSKADLTDYATYNVIISMGVSKYVRNTTIKSITYLSTTGENAGNNAKKFEVNGSAGSIEIKRGSDTLKNGSTVQEGDALIFTVTPNLGYAVFGVYGSATSMNTYNIKPPDKSSPGCFVYNYDFNSNKVNQIVHTGEMITESSVTKNNYAYFQNIYVCFKELTYTVTLKYGTKNSMIYLQNTAGITTNKGTTINALNIYYYLASADKKNGESITATVYGGTLKKFENLSQSTYNALVDALGNETALKQAFTVKYGDIVGSGKFVTDIGTDSFTIELKAEGNDIGIGNVIERKVTNYCNYWYDLNSVKSDDGGTARASVNGDWVTISLSTSPNLGYKFKEDKYQFGWIDGTFTSESAANVTIKKDQIEALYDYVAKNLSSDVLAAVQKGNGIFNSLKSNSTFQGYATISYDVYFALRQYAFQGYIVGDGTVAITTYDDQDVTNVKDRNKIFTASQKIYYNAPVVLVATPREYSQFVGWYLGYGQTTSLLSIDPQYHFVWDVDKFGERSQKQNLQITAVFEPYSKDVGTAPEFVNGVYQISNASHVVWLSHAVATGQTATDGKPVSEHIFKLMNDIDMTGEIFDPIGTKENPFKGIFDGNFKIIKNLKTFSSSTPSMNENLFAGRGLFGYTDGATIKNVTFTNANVTGYADIGVVAGNAKNTKFNRVEIASGALTTTGITFLNVNNVSRNADFDKFAFQDASQNKMTVQNHKATVNTQNFAARENFGGLVGYAEGCSFVGCSNRGELNQSVVENDGNYVGGLVGKANTTTTIDQCFNMADITTYLDKITNMLANGDGTITNCYYGDISLGSLDSLQNTTHGVLGLTVVDNADYSDIWGILDGKLVLKIFYWM